MDNEMRRMQQEAIHRDNEMQARAKQKLQGTDPRQAEGVPPPEPAPTAAAEPPEAQAAVPPGKAEPAGLQGLFDGLMEDRERTMILVLILLLFTEQADTAVIFALLYTVL